MATETETQKAAPADTTPHRPRRTRRGARGGGLRAPKEGATQQGARAPGMERRVGGDGTPRTLQEFIDHHGYLDAAAEWCRAPPAPAPPTSPVSAPVSPPAPPMVFDSVDEYVKFCSEATPGSSTPGMSDVSSESSGDDWEPARQPPWLDGRLRSRRGAAAALLSDEVDRFAAFVSLTPGEAASRASLRAALQVTARHCWPAATAKLCGSCACGLALPSSDVDVAVEGCGPDLALTLPEFVGLAEQGEYDVLSFTPPAELYDDDGAGIAEGCVRLRCAKTGLTADVTFLSGGGRSGMRSNVAVVKRHLARFPAARAVLLVVRTVLAQSNLSGAMPGGISSHALTVMVLHFFQAHYPAGEAAAADAGSALLDFLAYYGSEFDFMHRSVAIPATPEATPGQERELCPSSRVHEGGCVSVCDPADPARNIAEGCERVVQLRATFVHCRAALTRWARGGADATPLSSVIAARPRAELGAPRR